MVIKTSRSVFSYIGSQECQGREFCALVLSKDVSLIDLSK